MPGFFREALKNSETVDLLNHDPNYILGNTTPGTLKVWEDNTGLAYECTPPDTQTVRDMVLEPIKRGDLRGNSFGFRINGDGDSWDEDDDGRWVRTLKADGCKELFDGSQVTFPAYLGTELSLRSIEKVKEIRNKTDEDFDLSILVSTLETLDEEKREVLLKNIDTVVSKYAETRNNLELESSESDDEENKILTEIDERCEIIRLESMNLKEVL
jgi:HK97 family phage prohead protease